MGEGLKPRVFLALPLFPEFEEELKPLLEGLRRQCPEVRWISPSQAHLTLHFFGSIEATQVAGIFKLVKPIVQEKKAIQIFLRDIGGFPNAHHPRVIWAGVEGEVEALCSLQRQVEDKLAQAGFPCEERSFKAHLTLGRVRKEARGFQFGAPRFGPTPRKTLDKIVLFQSHLTPTGAQYEAIETYPLAAA